MMLCRLAPSRPSPTWCISQQVGVVAPHMHVIRADVLIISTGLKLPPAGGVSHWPQSTHWRCDTSLLQTHSQQEPRTFCTCPGACVAGWVSTICQRAGAVQAAAGSGRLPAPVPLPASPQA